MKTVWLVTHGETDSEPNPGLTAAGLTATERLKERLPEFIPNGQPTEIHCGTGRRQQQALEALGFNVEQAMFSDLWGGAATLVRGSNPKMIRLGHGTCITWDQYLSPAHLAAAIQPIIAGLPDNSLICSGRPVLVRLGVAAEKGQSGALYALRIGDDNSISIELVVGGVNLSK